MTTTTSTPFNRLLLTGAAGGLGKVLRERLRLSLIHISEPTRQAAGG